MGMLDELFHKKYSANGSIGDGRKATKKRAAATESKNNDEEDITTEEALARFEGHEPMSKEIFSRPVYGDGFRGDVPIDTLLREGWEEDAHPRGQPGNAGQFGSGGGGSSADKLAKPTKKAAAKPGKAAANKLANTLRKAMADVTGGSSASFCAAVSAAAQEAIPGAESYAGKLHFPDGSTDDHVVVKVGDYYLDVTTDQYEGGEAVKVFTELPKEYKGFDKADANKFLDSSEKSVSKKIAAKLKGKVGPTDNDSAPSVASVQKLVKQPPDTASHEAIQNGIFEVDSIDPNYDGIVPIHKVYQQAKRRVPDLTPEKFRAALIQLRSAGKIELQEGNVRRDISPEDRATFPTKGDDPDAKPLNPDDDFSTVSFRRGYTHRYQDANKPAETEKKQDPKVASSGAAGAIQSAYDDLKDNAEYAATGVPLPRLFRAAKRQQPDLTEKEFHAHLKALAADGKAELGEADPKKTVSERHLGIEDGDKTLYYVKLKEAAP